MNPAADEDGGKLLSEGLHALLGLVSARAFKDEDGDAGDQEGEEDWEADLE